MEAGHAPSGCGFGEKALPSESPAAFLAHSVRSLTQAQEGRLDLLDLPGGGSVRPE